MNPLTFSAEHDAEQRIVAAVTGLDSDTADLVLAKAIAIAQAATDLVQRSLEQIPAEERTIFEDFIRRCIDKKFCTSADIELYETGGESS